MVSRLNFDKINNVFQLFASRAGIYFLFSYCCLCLSIFAVDFIANVLNRPYLVNDDCLQQLFIFCQDNRQLMRELFPAVGLYEDLMPIGYKVIYTVACGTGIDPVTFSKVLTFILFSASSIFLAFWGWRTSGITGALIGFTFFFIFWGFYERMAGGLPRAFGYPVALLFVTAFLDRRIWWMAIALWAGALFYPPLCPFMAAVLTLTFLLPEKIGLTVLSDCSLLKRIYLLSFIGVVSLLLVAPSAIKGQAWGPIITGDAIRDLPEMQSGGRYDPADRTPSPPVLRAVYPALYRTFLISDSGKTLNVNTYLPAIIVFSMLWLFFDIKDRKRQLMLLWLLLFPLYWLSAYFYPLLYIPTRNFIYILPVLMIVSIVFVVSQNIFRNVWLRVGMIGIIATMGLLNIHQASIGYRYDFAKYSQFYHFISSLPRNSVVAGWPTPVLDAVPLFSNRSIFVGQETYQLFHKKYLQIERERMRATLTLIFTDSPQNFENTVNKHSVDFLLLPKGIHQADCNRLKIFRPFTSIARSLCEISSKPFASTFKPIWQDRSFMLLKVRE